MSESKEIELKQFLDISQKMLECATSNDWDKLPDLESDRKKIMLSLFESEESVNDLAHNSAEVEQAIKNVLLINEKIEQLAQQEKATIGQQLQGLKKKQSVHSAYLQNK